MGLLGGNASGQYSTCPASGVNVYPCNCTTTTNDFGSGDVITCVNVALADVTAMISGISKQTAQVFGFEMTPMVSETTITANALTKKFAVTGYIKITCPAVAWTAKYRLTIKPKAFAASQPYTQGFILSGCDLTGFSFNFLDSFANLNSLVLDSVTNLPDSSIDQLPSLPSLSSFTVSYTTGLNSWTNFPQEMDGDAISLTFDHTDLNDQGVANVLDWASSTFSDTLTTIAIYGGQMTQYPVALNPSNFPALDRVILDSQKLTNLAASSLTFSQPITLLYINNCGVKSIDSGTLVGSNFGDTAIYLSNNKLSTFDEGVFRDVLTQMSNSDAALGYIDVFKS